MICCCFFARSSQGFNRRIALPSTTVGNPEMAVYAAASGICAYISSIGLIWSAVYCGVEPCGAVTIVNTIPRSSIGASSDLSSEKKTAPRPRTTTQAMTTYVRCRSTAPSARR